MWLFIEFNLPVINAKLSVDSEHWCTNEKEDFYFSKLKLVYFFLVHYVILPDDVTNLSQNITAESSKPASALHCVLTHAKFLEGIQATGLITFSAWLKFTQITRNIRYHRHFFIRPSYFLTLSPKGLPSEGHLTHCGLWRGNSLGLITVEICKLGTFQR